MSTAPSIGSLDPGTYFSLVPTQEFTFSNSVGRIPLAAELGWHQLEPICHGSVSHIVVEPVPAYCAGTKVVGMHTVAPLAAESGVNIALTSRGEQLDVSVFACPDNVPAIDEIATGIAHSVGVLVAAAQESPRGRGRSVVTDMAAHPAKRIRGQRY